MTMNIYKVVYGDGLWHVALKPRTDCGIPLLSGDLVAKKRIGHNGEVYLPDPPLIECCPVCFKASHEAHFRASFKATARRLAPKVHYTKPKPATCRCPMCEAGITLRRA
jgi:hypothetical protein